MLGWILTNGVMFWCQFWGENTSILYGQQNNSIKKSVTGKVTVTEALWLPSSVFCPASQVKRLSSRVPRTQLESGSDPELQFLHRDGRYDDETTTPGLYCKSGHTGLRNVILPFGKAANFPFLGVHATATFHHVCQIRLIFTALHWLMWWLIPQKAEISWFKFCLSRAAAWDRSRHCRSPVWPVRIQIKGHQTVLEPFRL